MGMMMGEGAYRPGVRPTGRKWPRLEDELGGFIFITSADAMREARNDGEEEQGVEDKMSGTVTMKFALPAAFAETVAKIALGMPVFLYDVTHRLLHGVYEASPCEEQQSRNSAPANGLRFPAHVSMVFILFFLFFFFLVANQAGLVTKKSIYTSLVHVHWFGCCYLKKNVWLSRVFACVLKVLASKERFQTCFNRILRD